MRWVVDAIVLLCAAGLLVAIVLHQQGSSKEDAEYQRAASALSRLDMEIRYRSASRLVEVNARGWPMTIDPKWFDEDPPRNMLIPAENPWIEIASREQAALLNPPVRMALDPKMAGFWYNPYQGVVRARVPVMVRDAEAIEVYNRINGTKITSLFQLASEATDQATHEAMLAESEEDNMDPTKPADDIEITVTGKVRKRGGRE